MVSHMLCFSYEGNFKIPYLVDRLCITKTVFLFWLYGSFENIYIKDIGFSRKYGFSQNFVDSLSIAKKLITCL